ncbi:MAG: phytoene desaturase [Flavobacteriales bacterium]|nr:phytoene desaturase [Flavobacteriales bacterium]
MHANYKIAVIGSGFAGLSAAAYLAKSGCQVDVFEKNTQIGGRARQFNDKGYLFDMGPSWYWMPEVFESFYNAFGYTTSDFYELERLSPAFDMIFEGFEKFSVSNKVDELTQAFEGIEHGGAEQFKKFMADAQVKYETSMHDFIYSPGLSPFEFMNVQAMKNAMKLSLFGSFKKHVASHFNHPKLRALMEFPVLFLGAQPKDTPSLYSMMNYAGLQLGTWYPQGGFFSVVKAMQQIGEELGVTYHTSAPVEEIHALHNKVRGISVQGQFHEFDAVVGAADYHHIESNLLDAAYRNYNEAYWQKKVFAPSSLIYYLGIDQKVEKLNHHTLFFDEDLDRHADEIYNTKKWPTAPLFYVCAPSKTDPSVAPAGKENLFLLMPLATGLEDSDSLREQYFDAMMERLEAYTNTNIRGHIEVKHAYCLKDFENDYNAYGGNAYGLANTLRQTAFMKPKMRNKKLKNLVYAGQLTVPGPGVPPAIISGKIAADQITLTLNTENYEITV